MNFSRYQPEQTVEDHNINIFWTSMSDLLLGLLIVFIVLFSLAMIGFTKQRIEQEQLKSQIISKLTQEFKKSHIPVEIDKMTGDIKISDLELFELNKWTISPKGKDFLNKVIPVYFKILLDKPNIKTHISQIIIEGHTDTQSFKNSKTRYENYTKNLDLSLKRAFAVTDYIVNTSSSDKYKNVLLKLLSINGKSDSEPVIINGKEDFTKSRRVELKFQLKDYDYLELIKKYKLKR